MLPAQLPDIDRRFKLRSARSQLAPLFLSARVQCAGILPARQLAASPLAQAITWSGNLPMQSDRRRLIRYKHFDNSISSQATFRHKQFDNSISSQAAFRHMQFDNSISSQAAFRHKQFDNSISSQAAFRHSNSTIQSAHRQLSDTCNSTIQSAHRQLSDARDSPISSANKRLSDASNSPIQSPHKHSPFAAAVGMQPQPAAHILPCHVSRSIPGEPDPTCKSTRSRGKRPARHARRLNGSAA